MDTFGLFAKGTIILERLESKPPWTMKDCGRFIYDLSTHTIWMGGSSSNDGDNGWFQIGLTKAAINTYHIDWDTELSFLSNKISAINIPCYYNSIKTNVQDSILSILENINDINSGFTMVDEAIKSRHIDLRTEEGLNASLIKIVNSKSYFTVTNVDLALDYCYELSKNPLLPDDTSFGTRIGIKVPTVNEALIELEKYLKTFKSVDISATYLLSPESTNVQFVLDALYKYISEVEILVKMTHNITSIQGVPDNFGKNLQFLQSNGINGYCLIDLTSEIIPTRYCLETVTVQNAFDTICGDITSLGDSLTPIIDDIADMKIQIYDILCQIESILDKILLLQSAICELWAAIEDILNKITEIWTEIDLIWAEICRIWVTIGKILEEIGNIEVILNQKRIYFTVMKCTTNWEYGSMTDTTVYAQYPPLWLYCDFTSWYDDYRTKYSPNVGKNFIVVPIVQFQSFLMPNAFQCWGYICNHDILESTNPRNPVWPLYPPTMDGNPTFGSEYMHVEGGTLGEYPFVLYRGALGGAFSDNEYEDLVSSSKPKPYYNNNNWQFIIDIGTIAMNNNKDLKVYSGGGRIDYVIYFFGFGSDEDGILDINSIFSVAGMNIKGISPSPPIATIMQSGILAT